MASPEPADATRLVLIPSYDTGPRLVETVLAALAAWRPVLVVLDGSSDDSAARLAPLAIAEPALDVLVLARNRGKGGAVEAGARVAAARGFTHVLTMDADGQHPAAAIFEFMAAAARDPHAMILGRPLFGPEAPAARVQGRRISNFCAAVETLGAGIGDALCGFRVYPITDLLAVMAETRFMRRFDFEPEAVVRLCWRGLRVVNRPVSVRYFRREEGGVSHFRYGRDNLLLTWMHLRLLGSLLCRLPRCLFRQF